MPPGFNKRKRDVHGNHEFRPRLSPAEQRAVRIRRGIAEIGEPSRIGREVVLKNLSEDLREAAPETYPEILAITRAVVFEQPHKIGYLSFLFYDANGKKPASEEFELPFLVLEMAHNELSSALSAGDYDRVKVFLRFLAALGGIIENADELVKAIDAILEKIISSSGLPTGLKAQLYGTALFAAVYLPAGLVTEELQAKFASVDFPELAAEGQFDFFFGDEAPYKTQSVGWLLSQAARKLKDNGWVIDFLATNPLDQVVPAANDSQPEEQASTSAEAAPLPAAELSATGSEAAAGSERVKTEDEGVVAEASDAAAPETAAAGSEQPEAPAAAPAPSPARKHRLRKIHLPDPLPAPASQLRSDAFCRIYLPTEGINTVPEPTNVVGLLLRDVAVDNIRHMDFNRREVTRQLIALDMFFNQRVFAPPGVSLDTVLQYSNGEPTYKIEDMALEAVYSQMFDLTTDGKPFPLVYYHTLLVEACVMAPQDIAPVLGRALRFIFNHLATVDAELLFRAVDWFSHHVSNFAFTWKWNEWVDTLQLPQHHPQQVFVRELLAKQVRLSYAQRVRDVLPEEFQPLVPDTPDMPPFKYAQDEKVLKFVDALQNPSELSPGTLLEEFEPEERPYVLVTSVCDLGNRSITHASNWVAKTIELVRKYATNEAAVVEAVFAYWQQSQWIGALVVAEFIKNQLVSAQTYVNFIVKDTDLLLSSVGWEAIHVYVREARQALEGRTIEAEWGDWWTTRLHKALDRKQVPEPSPVDAASAASEASMSVDVQDAQDEVDYEPQPAPEKPEGTSEAARDAEEPQAEEDA